ncbi:hypothetical protein LMG27177_05007 [Paraburkholderia fynbosensis]|uniref:Uncharacterized protein n=1 Tax=Paraburkholderia fynbosensis TaxID=1200993 RepID=A0A6J5GMX4_9BURK|nr:hypothetical protein LMG27177_05007 [Paraburkholderia fynbosensis]
MLTSIVQEIRYRPNAAANQLQLLGNLSRWLASRRLDATMLTDPVLGEFLDARRAQGYTLWLSTKALVPMITVGRDWA